MLRRIDQRDLHVFDPHNLNFYIAVHVLINNLLRTTRWGGSFFADYKPAQGSISALKMLLIINSLSSLNWY